MRNVQCEKTPFGMTEEQSSNANHHAEETNLPP